MSQANALPHNVTIDNKKQTPRTEQLVSYYIDACMYAVHFTHRRSEVDVFSGVCLFVSLFVCSHDNFRMERTQRMGPE